jgi:hypothetical protein
MGRMVAEPGPFNLFHYSKCFSNIQSSPNFVIKIRHSIVLQNTQTLHERRFEYFEQLSQLGRPQIPNIIHVINFGTD